MRFAFDEERAAEAATRLLALAGGELPHLTLIKLLYLADRQALIEYGQPITGDKMVSMEHGPVLSAVLDRLNGVRRDGPWASSVSAPADYTVHALRAPQHNGPLSNNEIAILGAIYDRWGGMDKWDLVAACHQLPEWRDPDGSSLPIDPVTILRSTGKSDEEIEVLVDDAEAAWSIDRRTRQAS